MGLDKPYFRIARPFSGIPEYCEDERYADDRSMLCRAYHILQSDLKKAFEYIEPCDDNKKTYSHRLYELFLRASTEFETNCRKILGANDYKFGSGNPNIIDYAKINRATKLSEYEATLNFWRPNRKTIKPFESWGGSHSLPWYQAYNKVKHDRQAHFYNASLDNVIHSVAGVYITLFAQFDFLTLTPYQANPIYLKTSEEEGVTIAESLFEIKKPLWSDSEKYQFDWNILKNDESPFEKFPF